MSLSELGRPTIGFIGTGTVGKALAIELARRGHPVVAVSSRSFSSARGLALLLEGPAHDVSCIAYKEPEEVARAADIVFITTPDDAIGQVSERVRQRGGWRPGCAAVHCSGVLSLDPLQSAKDAGASIGSVHPIQSFAAAGQSPDLSGQGTEIWDGVWWGIEAEEPLRSVLRTLVGQLGGRSIVLDGEAKVLYHTAAVFVSNYLVTLVKIATDLWQEFGIADREATQALLPLLKGTIRNIEEVGLPGCLTGPIARGDLGTVRRHLESLERRGSSLVDAYRVLGLLTIPIAVEKGPLDTRGADELRRLLAGH